MSWPQVFSFALFYIVGFVSAKDAIAPFQSAIFVFVSFVVCSAVFERNN